ncbi:MAG: hypothetical protein HY791_31115 [Deltaproteobacteria bacterium]|nr:hypothetical protein [Deltaproteobacteria bacterium]
MGRQLEPDLAVWIERVEGAIHGDEVCASEVLDSAALLARRLGLERRPASIAVGVGVALEDVLRELSISVPTPFTRKLIAVLSDAHSLGTREEVEDRYQRTIRDGSPIVSLEDRAVIGFLVGPSSSDALDAMVGRLLRESIAAAAPDLAIDVFGADPPDDRFFQTMAALTKAEQGAHLRKIVICGVPDASRAAEQLDRFGGDPKKLRLVERVNDYIAEKIR